MEQVTATYTKRGNLVTSKGFPKHYSKRYIGFSKMCTDQDAKPEISSVETGLISFDEDECEYLPLKQKFRNNKWNGMNLKDLRQREWSGSTVGHFHSKRTIDSKTGLYKLTLRGKQILEKKRKRKHENAKGNTK